LLRELAIKGPVEHQGETIGTWFQVSDQINHWISFRKDRFQASKYEAFYKCVLNEKITYYRRVFYGVVGIITFVFLEKDEWIKVDGKWKNKYS
jgi:hypothetical protein